MLFYLTKKSTFILVVFSLCILYYFIKLNSLMINSVGFTSATREMKKITNFVNLYDLLEVCMNAAEIGGTQLVAEAGLKGQDPQVVNGLPYYPFTADVRSYCAMHSTIEKYFPHLEIISDGDGHDCEDEKTVPTIIKRFNTKKKIHKSVNRYDIAIWMQPLDGLREYRRGIYEYVSTMICVAVKGKPVIGIIHRPFRNTTTWAWVAQRASKDLGVSTDNPNRYSNNRVLIMSQESRNLDEYLDDTLDDFEVSVLPGYGYKFLQVATDKVDAYLELALLYKWDICAGNAIIDAIGGQVTKRNGEAIDYSLNSFVGFKEGLVASLLEHDFLVDKFRKPEEIIYT